MDAAHLSHSLPPQVTINLYPTVSVKQFDTYSTNQCFGKLCYASVLGVVSMSVVTAVYPNMLLKVTCS